MFLEFQEDFVWGKKLKLNYKESNQFDNEKYKKEFIELSDKGYNSLVIEISWEDIFNNSQINQNIVNYYHDLIDEMFKNGFEPVVSIFNNNLPSYIVDEFKDWKNRDLVDEFMKYADTLFLEFGSKIRYWVLFDDYELNFKKDRYQEDIIQIHHKIIALKKVINKARNRIKNPKLGINVKYQETLHIGEDYSNILAVDDLREMTTYFFLDAVIRGFYSKIGLKTLENQDIIIPWEEGDHNLIFEQMIDFIGFSNYKVRNCKVEKENKKSFIFENIENDTPLYNEAFKISLRRLTSRYDLPLLVLSKNNTKMELLEIHGAIHSGSEIIGYFPLGNDEKIKDIIKNNGIE